MNETFTLRLDGKLRAALDHFSKKEGLSRADLVRDTLRRQLAVRRLHELREKAIPYAEALGIYTDEDVFRILNKK